MDLNQLVCANQTIKIVPSIEDCLKAMGLNVEIDDNTVMWMSQLKSMWRTWKKSSAVDNHFDTFVESIEEPFRVMLICTINCPEFKDCKLKSLPFYIMESLKSWSDRRNILPPDTLKLPAFHVAITQRNQHFLTLVINTYQINTVKEAIIPIVKEMIQSDNSKQALNIVTAMKLFDDLPIEDLLFPFILQDRANCIDVFLSSFPEQVKPLLKFLDMLLDKNFSATSYAQNFAYKNNISNVNYNKIHYKPLGKFVGRICNKFNIPIETCKNLSKNRTTSGLKFLIYQKYVSHSISVTVWDDLVKDTLKNNIDCAQEFIDNLFGHDAQEALKWAKYFNVSDRIVTIRLQNVALHESPHKDLTCNERNDTEQYYKHAFTKNEISIIDSSEKFNDLIANLINENIFGIDCEWKPSFGATPSQVALIQIATNQCVYLIDTITLNGNQNISLWNKFNKLLLENAEIIKVGFGLEQDLKEIKASVIGLHNIKVKGEGLLDLGILWRNLINCGLSLPTDANNEKNSLSSLVESCFGLPLEKSEQCSNWELRPLRSTQVHYAALDAFVLIASYKYLQKMSLEQAINFDEVCNDVMLDKKSKSTKKAKIDKLLSKSDMQPRNVQSIKFLIESKLSLLLSYLRYLGIDTVEISKTMLWHDSINLALSEDRMILTSKMKFSPSAKFPQINIFEVGIVLNNSLNITENIKKILTRFNIVIKQTDLLSRCIKCNGIELRKVTPNETNEFYDIATNSSDYNVNGDICNSDDDDPYNKFLSDSEDDTTLYQICKPKRRYWTSKGVEIDTDDIEKFDKACKPGTLCLDCGKLYWDDDPLYKSVCGINLINK